MFCWFVSILFYSFTVHLVLLVLLTSSNSILEVWKGSECASKGPLRIGRGESAKKKMTKNKKKKEGVQPKT